MVTLRRSTNSNVAKTVFLGISSLTPPTYLPTYLPTYIHTYIHTYLSTYCTHTHTSTLGMPTCLPFGLTQSFSLALNVCECIYQCIPSANVCVPGSHCICINNIAIYLSSYKSMYIPRYKHINVYEYQCILVPTYQFILSSNIQCVNLLVSF